MKAKIFIATLFTSCLYTTSALAADIACDVYPKRGGNSHGNGTASCSAFDFSFGNSTSGKFYIKNISKPIKEVIWKGAAFKGKVVTVDDEQETAEVEWVDAHMHGAHSEWHPEGGHQWSMIQIPHIKMKKLLDEYIKAHPKHMLSKEKQRRLHRPIEDTSHEHPEIHFERIGYWDRYNSGQGKYERFVDLQEGANGKVIEVPADLPFRDRSGRLHYRVVAKATKLSGDIEEMDRALFSEIQTLHDLERKSNYSRRPAFPFFSL